MPAQVGARPDAVLAFTHMSEKKIPPLGTVAAAQADEKKAAKGVGLLMRGLAAMGLIPAEKSATPDAKMSKKTTTTKRVEMEESDDSAAEAEEDMETTGSGSEDTESTGAEAEAEDTGAEVAEGATAHAATQDASEKALARAIAKAVAHPSVTKAFLAAMPEHLREVGALYTPERMAASVRKATGTKSTFAAMEALSGLSRKQKGNSEAMLATQAKLEARVAKVEGARRKDRVDAIVGAAKERGVPGATTKAGRAMLREYGMTQGTTALSAFIQAQGPGLRTREAIPRTDAEGNAIGAPSEADQGLVEKAMAGLSPAEREQFAKIAAEKLKALNGAAPPKGI